MKNSKFRTQDVVGYFTKKDFLKNPETTEKFIDLVLNKANDGMLLKSDVAELLTDQEMREMECVVVSILPDLEKPKTWEEMELDKIEKLVAKNGCAYINWSTTDCDGVHGEGSTKIRSLDDFHEFMDGCEGWVEGPFSYRIEAVGQDSRTYGQGWGIN